MKNRSGEKIKLASIDELLGVVNEESAMEIEISKIHPFKNHPFKVLDDEKMQDLVESVKINGVLTPVLLRMDENEEYEMVSGHRRMHAAQLAGLTTIPAIVRELSDDDAIVAMVDARNHVAVFVTNRYRHIFVLLSQLVLTVPNSAIFRKGGDHLRIKDNTQKLTDNHTQKNQKGRI